MTHDIFISHASVDKEIADAMTEALEAQGIQCWIAPRDIRPGDTWGGSIVRAIESSKMMVIIFSVSSNASRQVLREVERAVQKDVVLLPFRIDDVPPSGDMEYFLSATHWLDALTPDLDSHLQELITISNSILKKPTSSESSGVTAHDPATHKAEPSIGGSVAPKAQHPTSSAVVRDADNISKTTEGRGKETNEHSVSTTTQTSPVKELKLEARRTPPGTKAKHSQPSQTKEQDVSLKSAAPTAAKSDAKQKNSSFALWVTLLGLVSIAALGWYASQHTDLFQNPDSKPLSSKELAPHKAPDSKSTEKPANSIMESNSAAPKEPSTTSTAKNAPSIVETSDHANLDTKEKAGEEAVSEKTESDEESDLSDTVAANSEDQRAQLDSQSSSNEQSLASNQDDNMNEVSNSEPKKTKQTTKPQSEPQSKPKIDEIESLVNRANTGDTDAILELSDRFLTGAGVERNELESVRLLEMVANSGSSFAQNKLASYYANGTIVPRNDEEALNWYRLAAEQGDVNSQYSLGEIYEFGFGAEANLAEAKKWYTLAAEQGHMKAGLFLKNFQSQNELQNSPPSSPQSTPQTSQDAAPELN